LLPTRAPQPPVPRQRSLASDGVCRTTRLGKEGQSYRSQPAYSSSRASAIPASQTRRSGTDRQKAAGCGQETRKLRGRSSGLGLVRDTSSRDRVPDGAATTSRLCTICMHNLDRVAIREGELAMRRSEHALSRAAVGCPAHRSSWLWRRLLRGRSRLRHGFRSSRHRVQQGPPRTTRRRRAQTPRARAPWGRRLR
jgi:hypothetical protein